MKLQKSHFHVWKAVTLKIIKLYVAFLCYHSIKGYQHFSFFKDLKTACENFTKVNKFVNNF